MAGVHTPKPSGILGLRLVVLVLLAGQRLPRRSHQWIGRRFCPKKVPCNEVLVVFVPKMRHPRTVVNTIRLAHRVHVLGELDDNGIERWCGVHTVLGNAGEGFDERGDRGSGMDIAEVGEDGVGEGRWGVERACGWSGQQIGLDTQLDDGFGMFIQSGGFQVVA